MRRLFLLIALVSLCATSLPAEAQHLPGHLPEFSGGFVVGVPRGAFARHLSSPGFGLGAFLGQKLPGLPLTVGLDGALLVYGLDTRDRPFAVAYGSDVNAFTTHGIGMAHFVVRLQDHHHLVSPYADVLVGAKYFFTDTQVDGERWEYWGDPFHDTMSFDDLAFSYGMGGGVRLHLATPAIREDGPRGRLTFHAGIRYLFGSPATYLKRGSSFVEDGEIAYEAERSRTDMIVPEFGLTISMW